MSGILRITGSIDLAQFWPEGSSDADTSKILVSVSEDSFEFSPTGTNFSPTNVFWNAVSIGKGKKKVVDANSRITVRLQGVDAPELHFKAAPLQKSKDISADQRQKFNESNSERRQPWAESATVALKEKLDNFGAGPVPCVVTSFVDKPFEVTDTYGRFIGNILVGADTDINLWLVQEGWAYPTYYSSMLESEIDAFQDLIGKARRKGRIWRDYTKDLREFDADLEYRGQGADIEDDSGPVLMPKLYRRVVAYHVRKKAGLGPRAFKTYLEGSPDEFFETGDFLKNGPHSSATRRLSELVNGTNFVANPQDLVFKEKPSTLVDANDRKIVRF